MMNDLNLENEYVMVPSKYAGTFMLVKIPDFIHDMIVERLTTSALKNEIKDFMFEYKINGIVRSGGYINPGLSDSFVKTYIQTEYGEPLEVRFDISNTCNINDFKACVIKLIDEFKINEFKLTYDGGRTLNIKKLL